MQFSAIPDNERRMCTEAGCAIVLQCEISDSTTQVQWFKDGKQIFIESGVDLQSDGRIRKLIVQTAAPSHSGAYRCTTKDDAIEFHVEIRGDSAILTITYVTQINSPSSFINATNVRCFVCCSSVTFFYDVSVVFVALHAPFIVPG